MHIARSSCRSAHPFTGSPARPISRRSKSCTWRAPVAVPLTRSPDLPFTRCSKRCTCCTSSVLWPSNSQKKMHIANTFRSANRKTHSKRCTWRAPVAVPLTRSPDPPLARSHDAPKAARCAHRLPFQAPAPPALAHPIQRPSAPLRVAHNSHYPMEHACQRESCEYDTFTQDALHRRQLDARSRVARGAGRSNLRFLFCNSQFSMRVRCFWRRIRVHGIFGGRVPEVC